MNKSVLFLAITITLFRQSEARELPRVFIFTDINIDAGDPDDRQSLIHLLWYADELKIEGVIPDRWNASGYEACQLVIDAYAQDYDDYSFKKNGYPQPIVLKDLIATDKKMAAELFQKAASDTTSPLYVLIWGNMHVFNDVFLENPALSTNIRIISIATGLMTENSIPHLPDDWEKHPPCEQMNWNSPGRNTLYSDSRFNDLWWLEINWTYEGMFTGEEPKEMFENLSHYGSMGKHIKEVVKNEVWAQYFRVGDTPTVLYMIDPENNLDDPTLGSWAGKFVKPFPEKKPNYFTDFGGEIEWNYADPCRTWQNHEGVVNVAKNTLEERRSEMYTALLDKLTELYSD